MVQNEAGEVFGLEKVALDHVESVTVEHENQVQVSINKVMSYLKHVFPAARKVALTNCIACEVKMNYLFLLFILLACSFPSPQTVLDWSKYFVQDQKCLERHSI